MPNTHQTLQVNSKAGTLFFEASNDAFANGTKTFEALKDVWKELSARQQTSLSDDVDIIDPDLSKNRTLN